jgi:two-component system sensor histidine kinase/response regulator
MALKVELKELVEGFSYCHRKLKQAVKFITFFVNDILDYSMLSKKKENFTADIKVFDVRKAVSEILSMQVDRAAIKNI